MRVLQSSNTKLTLQYRPFWIWATSSFFCAASIYALLSPGEPHEAPSMWLMLVGSAVWLFGVEWVTTTVDLPRQTLTVRRNCIALRARQMRCKFSQVKDITINSYPGQYWCEYKLHLLLHSGTTVSLMYCSKDESNTREMAQKLGQCTDKQVSENDYRSRGWGWYYKEQFTGFYEFGGQRISKKIVLLSFFLVSGLTGILAGILR